MYLKKSAAFLILTVSIFVSAAPVVDSTKSAEKEHAVTDSHFIEMMRMHHEEGVAMAKLGKEKGQHAEVKKVSQNIIDAQAKEIAQMFAWKKKWFAKKDMKMNMDKMDMSKMGMGPLDMSTLKMKSGKYFDKTYLEMMAKHHEGAVKMAQTATPKMQQPELKSFAEKITKDQTAEIAQLEKIKSAL